MGEIAPEEQFLPLSTIFYYLMLDFYVKTGIRFSLRDKRLFETTEVEITRVNCIFISETTKQTREKIFKRPLKPYRDCKIFLSKRCITDVILNSNMTLTFYPLTV